jgi:DNA repair protein RadC
MSIIDWPKEERPREKLLARGARALSDAELLAIFIHCGTRGKTAVDVARDLLKNSVDDGSGSNRNSCNSSHSGSLKKILDLSCREFCRNLGLGVARYAQLQAALEIGRRYVEQQVNGREQDRLSSVASAKSYCATQLSRHQQEVFAVAFMDAANRVIHYAEMFYGTINRAVIYPREVVRLALQHNAVAVVLMHNHLSGRVQPSADDQTVTRRMEQALSLIDVCILDHIIVGIGSELPPFSFAENGMLVAVAAAAAPK